jgi:creatinine amidohydrolase
MRLSALTSPEVRALRMRDVVVVLPLGSFEQHGPHLPLTTDSDIVAAVAGRVENLRPETVLELPTLWPGHSTHHDAFPGTLSVAQLHYIPLVVDLCRSIVAMGAAKLFLLNGHGGNDVPVRAAMRELKTELGRREGLHLVFASYWSLAGASLKALRESELGGMGHACELETSIMLHLDPARVRMELAAAGGPPHPFGFRRGDLLAAKPVYTVSEFHELSPSGVVGRPDLATAEKGARFLDAIVRDVTAFVDDFLTW